MAEIPIRITELEAILENHAADHTQEELAEMEDELDMLQYVEGTWDELMSTPTYGDPPRLLSRFDVKCRGSNRVERSFPAGTWLEEIRIWIGTAFHVDVARDLADE